MFFKFLFIFGSESSLLHQLSVVVASGGFSLVVVWTLLLQWFLLSGARPL